MVVLIVISLGETRRSLRVVFQRSRTSSLPGVEDHEGPVFDLLPGTLLVLVLVVGVVLGARHGVAAVLAVAASAAVDAAASSPGDGGAAGGRTFIQERGERVLLGGHGASLAAAAGLAVVGVGQLGVALPSNAAAAVALPSSRPPAVVFSFPVHGRFPFLRLQRRLQVDVSWRAAGTASESSAAAAAAEVVPDIYVGVAHVGVGSSIQGDEPRPRVLFDAQLQQLLLGQRLQLSVHLSHGGVVEEHRDGHRSAGGVGRPAGLLGVVALGTALLLLLLLLALFLGVVVVVVMLTSAHRSAVLVLLLPVLSVFTGELGGQPHVVGGDDQRGHHAAVHVLLHLVDGAAEDDLARLRVEGGGPGEAVGRRRRVLRRFVGLARHVALETGRRRGVGGVSSIVVGVVVAVILGLFALHGAVAPVVVLVQQRVVQVVGLRGTRDLHGETFPSLRT